MKQENTVILRGSIVQRIFTQKVAILRIKAVSILANTPEVMFFKNTDDIFDNYAVGDTVEIVGQICSYKKDEFNPSKKTHAIVGESIKSIPENLVHDRNINNQFQISGMILDAMRICDNLVKFKVLTLKDNHFAVVSADYYTDTPDDLLSKFDKGQEVSIAGMVQTLSREKEGVVKHYENYVIKQITTEFSYGAA